MSRLLIVPAAGLASRLRSTTPKILHPVNGRPMIDHLLELYRPVVDRFIVVAHPTFRDEVERHCATRDLDIECVEQREPTGMLDAILVPHARVGRRSPDSVWITWGDQIAIHPRTVRRLADLDGGKPRPDLALPTAHVSTPYIHFVRDAGGRIVAILHRREGDAMPETGESDMGLFSLSGRIYIERLPEFSRTDERGARTSERNFLPFIPWLANRGDVRTFPCEDATEAIGINTPDDLSRVAEYLRTRDAESRTSA